MTLSDWELLSFADHLSIAEAACCIIGISPADVYGGSGNAPQVASIFEGDQIQAQRQLDIVVSALLNAARAGTLPAKLVHRGQYHHVQMPDGDFEGFWEPVGQIDPWQTIVSRSDLKRWIENTTPVRPPFFFGNTQPGAEYLDPTHPRYAPKLAAAVKAWIATGDEKLIRGKHPKQALAKWLREHAAEFGLTDDEGKPNETGIEEAAKVANWRPAGGAPRTPETNPPQNLSDCSEKVSDEPIPF